jgi:hypothetical protein
MLCAGSYRGGTARVIGLGLCALATAAAAVARARPAAAAPRNPPDALSGADKAAALAATREGNRLLDAGKPEEALAKFREAHRLVGGDKLRFNMGQALRAIPGREVEAFTEFDTFLARVPSAPANLVEEAATERRTLGATLGFITVDAPAEATVIVDGQAAGKAPLPQAIVVRPGAHRLRIEKTGFRPVADDVTVGAGQRVPRAFTLDPIPVAVRPEGAGDEAAIDLRAPPAGDAAAASPGLLGRWWFWTAAGVVVAAALGAVWLARGETTHYECPAGVTECRTLP